MTYSKDHPVYTKLRKAIVSGEIAPGSHLKISRLSKQLRTSTAPLREALTRLASEDLVHSDFSHGYTVRTISFTELSDTIALIELTLISGFERISHKVPQEILTQTAGLVSVSSLSNTSRPSLGDDLQAIVSCCRALMPIVAERQLARLALLMLPFQTGTLDLEPPDFPRKDLLARLAAALQAGELTAVCDVLKEYFGRFQEALPFLFHAYERRQKLQQIS